MVSKQLFTIVADEEWIMPSFTTPFTTALRPSIKKLESHYTMGVNSDSDDIPH